MKYADVINELQTNLLNMQKRLDQLKRMDITTASEVFLTRQEAADFICKSLRQLDRDCARYGIPKVHVNGGIRIRKSDLLKHMGLLGTSNEEDGLSERDRIFKRHWEQ